MPNPGQEYRQNLMDEMPLKYLDAGPKKCAKYLTPGSAGRLAGRT